MEKGISVLFLANLISNISHVCSPIYGVLRGFLTCHWPITYHEAIMCKSNTLIIIRMWFIFRNSVLKIDGLMFPQNLQF